MNSKCRSNIPAKIIKFTHEDFMPKKWMDELKVQGVNIEGDIGDVVVNCFLLDQDVILIVKWYWVTVLSSDLQVLN